MMSSNHVQMPLQEGQQLLQLLSGMSEVELWRVHWCLSQNLIQEAPPIPPHWLWAADACSTAKTMMRCYEEEGLLTVLAKVLALLGSKDAVGPVYHSTSPPRPRTTSKLELDFVRSHRRRLISMVQNPNAILQALEDHQILTPANREAVSIYALLKDKNRALVDLVLHKGPEAQEAFCQALGQSEQFLLQELADEPISKNSPDTSDFLLEYLSSDELQCVQWLAKDHMTAESPSLIGLNAPGHGDQLGPQQAQNVAKDIVLKIVPSLCAFLQEEEGISQSYCDFKVNTMTSLAESTPEVQSYDGMFRLQCQQSGEVLCSLTGLMLEGCGDVVYEVVPWDVDYLSSRGLRPAGHLFRFILLSGSFQRLHLPHCQLISGRHSVAVAHITGDSVTLVPPVQVTDSHVTVHIPGFSCFGLLTSTQSDEPIEGLVLLFSCPTTSSIFVLLLPRNVCLTQVRKELRRRTKVEYVEVIPDCELIPNQTYKLTGQPATVIQPATSKFINFADYNNFLPSFQIQLPAEVTMVKLQLWRHVTPPRLIGWLFGPVDNEVWTQVVLLNGSVCAGSTSECETKDVTLQLFQILNRLTSDELKDFQHFLTVQTNPIPVGHLESASRTRTVTLMVQQYHAEGARVLTEEILRKMNQNQLADDLSRT
ncbi:uncharacterized protein LOC133457682 [Cololabis saira]|uniref:uncharacterized protein LOC133457682 n=1 Tax=Cololabis saira TaxID=129043 RepID=UPI002AD35CD2|nr:uncharacterized protein LOC133457682 [Cololabis saira]